MRPFFKKTVLERQLFRPMTIVIDTTKAGSASNTFILPIVKDVTEAVKINWGDGTNSIGVNGGNTHVYASSGIYTITIKSRLFGGVIFDNIGDKDKLLSISSFGDGIIRSFARAFFGCTSLRSTANIKYSLSGDFTSTYRLCSIAAMPMLNFSNITNVFAAFSFNAALTAIPLFDFSNVTIAQSLFYGDTSLVTIPLLDFSKVTNSSFAFFGCTSLNTVPPLNLSSVTNAASMFSGCTLTTQSYSDFLINLATLSLQSGVSFHGGNSKYNTAGAVARAYLISTFGWTIIDGGAAP